jgi:hypothetical protein
MRPISQDVWLRLAEGKVAGQMLWARRASPETTARLLAAIDADGARHYLIRVGSEEPRIEDSESRGFGVSTRDLSIPGSEAGTYIDLICRDATGYEIFNIIGGEIAEKVAAEGMDAVQPVKQLIAKWRRFWSQVPQHLLTLEEQVGLFAELWFLCQWLVPMIGTSEAMKRWRGPFGARHDFEWAGGSVEVKGTRSTRGDVHWIHGLDQLSAPEVGPLYFFSLGVREEAGAVHSLFSVVEACHGLVSSDDESWARFESGLAQSGYVAAHAEEYATPKWRIATERLFLVTGDFPRLTQVQLVGGVPRGLEHVDYQISLSGFERLQVAQKSDDPTLIELLAARRTETMHSTASQSS